VHFGQERDARDIFIARVGVGEVCADVAEGGRAEERIADGVHEHISIGVSGEPSLIGDFDAA
jgi:hypothetical protein